MGRVWSVPEGVKRGGWVFGRWGVKGVERVVLGSF